tara:strand:+ start:421 stop:966 length:546 start_codon:yes stop_codon:yes gene_type:complete
MLIQNNLKKFKEIPEVFKGFLGLFSLIILIVLTFFILNIYFGPNNKVISTNNNLQKEKIEEVDQEIISLLPRGKLVFFESNQGYKLSLNEYEMVCKNTKIVTQRAVMGANITDSKANKLYIDNGNKIDSYSVKWDSTSKKCFAGYTVRALAGTSKTVTVEGEAQGFLKTSIDTRVYFIKNF